MKIYLNGKFVEKKDAKVSVFDHGFLYGDGVFEGIRSYKRNVFKLQEHIQRLYESAHTLMLKIPLTQAQMIDAVVRTLKSNHLSDAYIRVIVSRGEGDLGLDPRKCQGTATVIVITDKITLYPQELYQKGMAIITVPTVRNLNEAVNPQLKSLNYLNNILAKIEATNSGCMEALMMDAQGFVAECTGDNVFIVRRGELLTPPNARLRGITRDAVMELAKKQKIMVSEKLMTRHEIFVAEECFLTGTAAEIIPIVKVDGRVIGDGVPGPITLKLIKAFHTITSKDGVKY
ncbi:MAG TPA: branched-chain-amino-acid transaminase [Candidatus Omnitrophota bacterium]|nr:branched-chain-amino-acid transaminase [Candidatus Omnitrophota bacterium]HQL40823.1 branched-chain-amino-acid transaminase [Candidatus Omnitrophota bacterium]